MLQLVQHLAQEFLLIMEKLQQGSIGASETAFSGGVSANNYDDGE